MVWFKIMRVCVRIEVSKSQRRHKRYLGTESAQKKNGLGAGWSTAFVQAPPRPKHVKVMGRSLRAYRPSVSYVSPGPTTLPRTLDTSASLQKVEIGLPGIETGGSKAPGGARIRRQPHLAPHSRFSSSPPSPVFRPCPATTQMSPWPKRKASYPTRARTWDLGHGEVSSATLISVAAPK
ncbi:uncharacterized protein EHS24_009508 [Apiotrichum porosum]|uniref:Uncharacterized protein n=1 Tax=Apiotrichum porosum TaxID=105984 RepID=A0A427XMB0_9TREE|nr:uncharacterized protein EHS24_009508 [Apiotrichum porosum]RSH79847.1 hypothetical protein EHS24_009508 [Apiotrichum porosum]